MSPLWAFLAYGEQTAWWTMVGAALIAAGLALRYGKRVTQPPLA